MLLTCVWLSACSDVPLNQNAITLTTDYQMRQNGATQEQKDSYYYLLGIGSKNEPLQAGKSYHDELQALLQKGGDIKNEVHQLNKKHGLHELSSSIINAEDYDSEFFCHFNQHGRNPHACFEMLLTKDFDTSAYKDVYERYMKFLKNTPAVAQGIAYTETENPDYLILTGGQRLNLIYLLKKNNPNLVMQGLLDELSFLRVHLANANNLMDKMTYTNMIANQIQAIVLYHSKYPETKAVISPLNQDELSFKIALTSEFMVIHHVFEELDEQSKDVNMTLFYKKNKTMNAIADAIHEQITSSHLTAPEFGAYYHNNPPKTNNLDMTNVVGKILGNIGGQDYCLYIDKVKSIDNLINIANHRMNDEPLTNVFAPTFTKHIIKDDHICLQNSASKDEVATKNKRRDENVECLNI